ncbi:glycoside hydrolase family 71/99-like protein [Croceivirga radicis]|uniref:glycoside hydrolase family 71/99-like protein n=1 Tax=Croceivirga radicis TaxID=1929488 RepID=UPI000255AD34|nr:glycoside hydrolase family 71/99-like protein [Croceivirga radicis]
MHQKQPNIYLYVALAVIFLISCEKEVDNSFDNASIPSETTLSAIDLKQLLKEEDSLLEQGETGKIMDITGMDVVKTNPKKVFAHYMPWFQSKPIDGYWGKHWTMANKNPDSIDASGKREIASHFYPLIGPYSSIDPDLQEYHFLMMKLAGIDGVIFDWYGSRDFYDYQIIKEATESFMWRLEDLGLYFSVMYEDRTAVQAVELGFAPNKIEAAKQDFNYIKDTYFTSPRYMKWRNQPFLFVFGPHHIQEPEAWDEIFNIFTPENKPNYLSLWGTAANWVGENASGEFTWVDRTHLEAHDHYYWYYPQFNKMTVGSTYPGFINFSENGGWGLQHDWQIPHNNGDTFVETLNYTHHQDADFIQLLTWNDFGEGTMIEPTEEFGFMYLQLLQQYTGVPYTPEDLQTALELYQLRKVLSSSTTVAKSKTQKEYSNPVKYLDRAYLYMKKGQTKRAKLLLQAVRLFYGNKN